MKRLLAIVLCILVCFINPLVAFGEMSPSLKAAFVRDGNLWIKKGNDERQVTKGRKVANPRWSSDGKWLAYFEENQDKKKVWLYNLHSEKKEIVFTGNPSNIQWASNQNSLAFQEDERLYVKNVFSERHKLISSDVGNYSWHPNGKSFLTSTNSELTPDGWTDIELHEIVIKDGQIKKSHLFTLPAYSLGSEDFGIGTSIFKWSPDGKWISFIKYPTASLSADSNLLYVLSADGKHLIKLDQMLNEPSWFQWAPNRKLLAYIGGINRMSIMNKFLKVKELPAASLGTLTPDGFVDRDFTWHNDVVITVARSKESEWSNNPTERPMPTLYQIDLESKEQKKITRPEDGYGDFNPKYVPKSNQLAWVRTNREKSDVWIADGNGRNAKVWITDIDLGEDFYERWDWSKVLSI
ncbi:translocation protein TolB [Bacillus sp. Marseille-Q3570]|uniref:TolB family protein n=1 Tax=Bacillus sp. Marseille-Q3570 TaxID=2963522 RepID=UPI0021B781EF|nr:translocation protein TolB [Bacillus sp. Marseille-Q3570]